GCCWRHHSTSVAAAAGATAGLAIRTVAPPGSACKSSQSLETSMPMTASTGDGESDTRGPFLADTGSTALATVRVGHPPPPGAGSPAASRAGGVSRSRSGLDFRRAFTPAGPEVFRVTTFLAIGQPLRNIQGEFGEAPGGVAVGAGGEDV